MLEPLWTSSYQNIFKWNIFQSDYYRTMYQCVCVVSMCFNLTENFIWKETELLRGREKNYPKKCVSYSKTDPRKADMIFSLGMLLIILETIEGLEPWLQNLVHIDCSIVIVEVVFIHLNELCTTNGLFSIFWFFISTIIFFVPFSPSSHSLFTINFLIP